MFFFRRKKSSASLPSPSSETKQETISRRAQRFIATVQQHYPREFATLLSEVEHGDLARARLLLRQLGSIVDEGYIEPILQQLQTQVDSSPFFTNAEREDHPDALDLLIRSGNRAEAIVLYQHQTGADWQAALVAIKDRERKLLENDPQ